MVQLQAARDAADARARFVYIQDDGSARELSLDEGAYLATAFDPGDGSRPYIKSSYEARTPMGALRGYLHRHKLPAEVVVRPCDVAPG